MTDENRLPKPNPGQGPDQPGKLILCETCRGIGYKSNRGSEVITVRGHLFVDVVPGSTKKRRKKVA